VALSVTGSPHAVSQSGTGTGASFYYYDAHGNQTLRDAPGTAADRTIKYSVDDKAYEIAMGSGQRVRFWYGPDGQRYKREEAGKTTLYLGGVEVVIQGGGTTFKRYLGGLALQTVIGGVANGTKYLFHDHLGSLVRIANSDGSVSEGLDYAPFGGRRSYTSPIAAGTGTTTTDRSFTGHEAVDGTGVIHMNGRIYDAEVGRFLQTDPVIQAPDNIQSWNAYTYCFNNPLAYTDPSGNISLRQALGIVIAVVGMYFMPYASNIWINIAYGAAVGFVSGYVATGTLRGGITGAFTGGLTMGVGLAFQGANIYAQMFAQGITGGIVEGINGGDFGNGFLSAGLTTAFMPQVGYIQNDYIRTAVGAIVGGSISKATGGKFANGAISGAIQGAMSGSNKRRYASSKSDGKDHGWAGASPEDKKLLSDPATRERGIESIASKKGMIIQDEHLIYKHEKGPWNPQAGGFAAAEMDNGDIILYANSFDGNNYWELSSIIVHEYSHWLVWRFNLPGNTNNNLSESIAYKAQMDGTDFAKTTAAFQAHTNTMYTYYNNEYLLETRGYIECKDISRDC
jgi:RHS repeat-associated protein